MPFFSGAASVRRDWSRISHRVRKIVRRGRFTSHEMVHQLEKAIKEYTGAQHAIACNSGTDALILALRAAGVGPGDEVILPTYTFFASVSSVIHVGADPVLVDIVPGSYAIDPDRAAAAVTSRTKAIMPVHLFNQTADLATLCDLAEELGLQVIEDSAEAIGMRVAGRHAGRWGTAGVLSFFPTKTLGALGDAGMVLTDNEDIAGRVRRARCHGEATELRHTYLELGWNSRCDELQAAVLLTRLERLDQDILRRAQLAQRYSERLARLPQVTIPWQAPAKHQSNLVWYVYLLETERRDELVDFLADHDVGTEVYYPRPLSHQPCLRHLPGARHPVPVARAASRRAVGLPLYPDLTDEQVDLVCELIEKFHGGRDE
ncbi:DegT/DnrJ/EryC1/StrS family aminotransferase [Longimycelium tulufanense]|uniref:DegT/DnrJ/EryC1/StrS family aminotransferase n=1 Tax=Longimycelium tulufanense TaxID=907463 RepID=UPI00227B0A11|nr:DegT/DnrJ/EryC1/StrS family aminotransferase [Longimycelium tulufanense]